MADYETFWSTLQEKLKLRPPSPSHVPFATNTDFQPIPNNKENNAPSQDDLNRRSLSAMSLAPAMDMDVLNENAHLRNILTRVGSDVSLLLRDLDPSYSSPPGPPLDSYGFFENAVRMLRVLFENQMGHYESVISQNHDLWQSETSRLHETIASLTETLNARQRELDEFKYMEECKVQDLDVTYRDRINVLRHEVSERDKQIVMMRRQVEKVKGDKYEVDEKLERAVDVIDELERCLEKSQDEVRNLEREKQGLIEECQKIKCAKRVSDDMNERRIAELRQTLQQATSDKEFVIPGDVESDLDDFRLPIEIQDDPRAIVMVYQTKLKTYYEKVLTQKAYLQNILVQAEKDKKEYEKHVNELLLKLEQAGNIGAVEHELRRTHDQLRSAQRTITHRDETIRALKKQLKQMTDAKETAEKTLAQLKQSSIATKTDHQRRDTVHQHLKAQLETLREKEVSLQLALGAAEAKLKTLTASVTCKETTIKELRQAVQTASSQSETKISEDMEKAKSEMESLKKEIKRRGTRIEGLQCRIKTLEGQLHDVMKQLEKESGERKEQESALRKQVQSLNEEKVVATKQCHSFQQAILQISEELLRKRQSEDDDDEIDGLPFNVEGIDQTDLDALSRQLLNVPFADLLATKTNRERYAQEASERLRQELAAIWRQSEFATALYHKLREHIFGQQ